MPNTILLVLIGHNHLLREGLTRLIREQPGFLIAAACAHVDEALQQIRDVKPCVVLLDFSLEDDHSRRATATIRREVPTAKVIVMGVLPLQDVAQFVTAGASGFIMQKATSDELLRSIRLVASGERVLPRELTGSLFSQLAGVAFPQGTSGELELVGLTARERQVVDLICEGLSNKEIAVRLQIATHTVKSHVHNLLDKLALQTRLEVAAFSRRFSRPGQQDADMPDTVYQVEYSVGARSSG